MKKNNNLSQSPADTRDYQFEALSTLTADLPTTLDMRGEILPVRNQGSDGACVAFTASCMKEVQEKRDIGFDEYMSPQFIYSNRENKSTEGMYPRDLMRILTRIGSVTETMMPYQKSTIITPEILQYAANHKIKGYAAITTIDGMKNALVANGPALIGIPVYNYGEHIWKQRNGENLKGGHAVAVVGWTEEGFIIRNSWGTSWNGDGHTLFPFSHWGLQWEAWTTIDADSVENFVVVVEPKPLTPTELRRIRMEKFRREQAKRRAELMERIRKIIEEARRRQPIVRVVRRRRRRPVVTRKRRPNIAQERMRRAREQRARQLQNR
jgi:C1A family cysteine protease